MQYHTVALVHDMFKSLVRSDFDYLCCQPGSVGCSLARQAMRMMLWPFMMLMISVPWTVACALEGAVEWLDQILHPCGVGSTTLEIAVAVSLEAERACRRHNNWQLLSLAAVLVVMLFQEADPVCNGRN